MHLTADAAASSTGTIVSNYDTSDCVDVNSNSSADNAVVEMWGCNGGPAQVWTLETDGTVQHNGKCLDIYENKTANGAPIDQYTCSGGANQQWTRTGSTLVNPATGKCLDDPWLQHHRRHPARPLDLQRRREPVLDLRRRIDRQQRDHADIGAWQPEYS